MKKIAFKKAVCICIILVLLVAMLGVGKAYFFPSRANPILLARIEADYKEYYDMTERPKIAYCYGFFNGCVPVYVDGPATDMPWTEVVAGVSIHYHNGNFIKVWKNGEFMRLEEAYSRGFLSKEDIKTIASIHSNR